VVEVVEQPRLAACRPGLCRVTEATEAAVNMDPTYDIFKQSSGTKLVFVERFRSLTQAEQHVVSLGASSADEKYFIYDVREGAFLRSLAG
jgi:hypothetical protein